ncbi:MAG: hypothetical protein COV36_03860 [Alphaproteobacteria bacterium CG11_big_fil_rev_8_21_14_0_20_44_7]|nr:MAG: hypothetical protein COV36_03860 [Alphaproteobacteria bacterium CG11_big_fil_rev_8_21_14_0_20_44_7]
MSNIVKEFKRLPFIKSWQNSYVSSEQQIFNTETEQLETRVLEDFIYVPGPSLIRFYSSDPKFLAFRNDHKYDPDWNYHLLPDKSDNENRRLAVFFVAQMMEALEIQFMIDEGYGILVEIGELARLAKTENPVYKEIFLHFSIPKAMAKRNGLVEEWGA